MKKLRKAHFETMEALGINCKDKSYELCVDSLLHAYIDALMESDSYNKDFISREIKRAQTLTN